jgi:hypothetical protein
MSSAASTIYLGMDVHKDSITIAVLPGQAGSGGASSERSHQGPPLTTRGAA